VIIKYRALSRKLLGKAGKTERNSGVFARIEPGISYLKSMSPQSFNVYGDTKMSYNLIVCSLFTHSPLLQTPSMLLVSCSPKFSALRHISN
jgi:hypothetical protein